jgi:hypothetical protein
VWSTGETSDGDHIRDFINSAAMSFSPTDLAHTTAPILLFAGSP